MLYMGDVGTVRRIPQDFAQTVRFWADGRIEVATRDAIRHWADGIGDRNPFWLRHGIVTWGETARQSYDAMIELVSRAVPDEWHDKEVAILAEKLAAQSPTAMRMGLAAWNAQADRDLASSLPYLRDQLGAILMSEDAREGLMAFAEKREPKWTGR